MSKNFSSLLFGPGSFIIATFLSASVAQAGVTIVPESRGAVNLSPKTISLKTEISGRFARTTALWTFENSAKAPFEAEFVADAPREAVVTGFAYYFKNEKVVARVVEKLRAAQIYRGIVQQRRDPAVVEMLSRNTFRARISPVAPGADVRIETTWVQPLRHNKDGWTYEVPLRDKEDTWKARWSFNARVTDLRVVHPSANFTLKASGDNAVSSAQEAALPNTLRLTLRDPLSSQLVRSNSGGADYFALRTAPNEKVILPVGATQVWRSTTKMGTVTVGRLPRAPKTRLFGDAAEKLWAAAEIDALSANNKNQDKVMALSVRYGLTSKWTSWLAIPEEERQRLKPLIEREKRAQAEVNIRSLGVAMAQKISSGRAKGNAYAKMKVQFDANCRVVDAQPSERLSRVIDEQLAYNSRLIEYANYGGQNGRKDQKSAVVTANNYLLRVRRLRPYASERGRDWSSNAEIYAAQIELGYLAPSWASSRLKGHEDVAKRNQIVRVLRDLKPYSDDWSNNFSSLIMGPFATRWAQLKATAQPDQKKLSAARQEVEKAAQLFPTTSKYRQELVTSALSSAEYGQFYARIDNLKKQLATEVSAERESEKKAQTLRETLAGLEKRLEFESNGALSPTQLPLDKPLEKVAGALQQAELSENPDLEQIRSLQAEFNRLKGFAASYTVEQANKTGRRDVLSHLERQTAKDWVAAAQAAGPTSERATALKDRLQKILDLEYEIVWERSPGYNFKAEDRLKSAEATALEENSRSLREQLVQELGRLRSDQAKITEIRDQLDAMQKNTAYNQTQITQWLRWSQGGALEAVLENLRKEDAKVSPDVALVADLERRAIELQPFDRYAQNWEGWRGARHDSDPIEFGKLRVERIKVRSEREKAQQQLAKAPNDIELREEVAQWLKQENQLRVRMGDPLIAVAAPQNARQVLALFPTGEIKQLEWSSTTKRWEARFDVPTWSNQGDYTVQIVVVFQSGVRQKLAMHFSVDMQSPKGEGRLTLKNTNWFLRVETGSETDRVMAFMPWNQRLELRRNADGTFSANIVTPAGFMIGNAAVRLVLTDAAHNRTEFWVDFEKGKQRP